MRRLLPLMFVPLLLAAACADPNAPQPAGPADTYRAGDVVLRVEYVGGFVTPDMLITRLPLVTVYGDGRIVTQGAQIAIFPAPALPSVVVRKADPATVEDLVRQALDAGVGSAGDLGTPPVADVPVTRFTVVASAGVRQTDVEALGFDEGLTADQVAARQKLRALVETLSAAGADETIYEPTAMAMLSRGYEQPGLEVPEQEPRPWPGPALPGTHALAPVTGLTCSTVSGAELAPVLEAAATANQLTPWVWDGKQYAVIFRPLLPDETSCADLEG